MPARGDRALSPRHRAPASALLATLWLAAAACGPAGGADGGADGADVVVDPRTRHQGIEGWEVSSRLWEFDKVNDRFDGSWEREADAIFDALVDEVGVDRLRLQIKSGAENRVDHWERFRRGEIGYLEVKDHFYETVNDDDDPRTVDPAGFQFGDLDYRVEKILLPMRERLAARGERLFVNVCFVDFGRGRRGNLEHGEAPEEYAEFVLVHFLRLRDRWGVVPDALEIILEPDNDTAWDAAAVGHAIVAASRRLAEHGFDPEIIAPSTLHARRAEEYLDDMLDMPGVVGRLDVLSYHRYRGAHEPVIRGIGERARELGIGTAMLEHVGAGFDELFEDLTWGGVGSWQQWSIAAKGELREDFRGALLGRDVRRPEAGLLVSPSARALSQVFRHARRGAVRIGATSASDARRVLAFAHPEHGTSLVVETRGDGGPLRIAGLPAGRYAVRLLDADGRLRALAPVRATSAGPVEVDVPAQSLLALYSHLGDRGRETAPR